MPWALTERVATAAGEVAAGRGGKGPPLVLAHGWPWSSASWHRVIPALERHFTVHWYDMPGYGRSEMRPDQATSLNVQGDVFAAILAHFALERPLVWAHDLGGATTLRAHLLGGVDFAALCLMNVVAMWPWRPDFFAHVGRPVEAFMGLPPHIHRAVVHAYIEGLLVHPLAADDLERLAAPWLCEAGRVSFYRQFAQADERHTAEVEPLFGAVRCPVKIVWGTDDPWIPLSRGRALHDAMPQASFVPLEGAGHLPQLETPDAALAAAVPFLRSETEQL